MCADYFKFTWSKLMLLTAVATLVAGLGLFVSIDTAFAQAPVPNCMEDVVEQLDGSNAVPLNCTANDVQLGIYTVLSGPTSCVSGEDLTVLLQADLVAGAHERYDIGLFVALDGGDALRGTCHQDYLPPPLSTSATTSPPRTSPFYNAEATNDPGDTCGDLEQAVHTLRDIVPLTIKCQDSTGDGFADVGTCVSWDNGKSDGSTNKPSCTSQLETRPNTKAKCRCESVQVGEIEVLGQIIVDKVTVPPGDPTSFNFTLSGPDADLPVNFGLTDTDAPYESPGLDAGTYSVVENIPDGWDLTNATCDDGSPPSAIDLDPGEIVTCTFNDTKLVEPPDITVTKTADPTSVPEPGGSVTFYVTVVNNSISDATLDSLIDDIYGDLDKDDVGNHSWTTSICDVPQSLPANGGSYSCSFTGAVSGNAGDSQTDTVTATASNDAGSDTDSDDAIVTIDDVPSAIQMIKTATPDHVDEPGGSVTYDFTVNNLSTVDSVTIDTLDDTLYGDLTAVPGSTCTVPQTLARAGQPGDSYSCSITVDVSGNAGGVVHNVATASGLDDDGNPVSDDDFADVIINDVPPAIQMIKTATPNHVDEPGGSVTYNFTVNNLSAADSVTIDTLNDTIYGDLTAVPGSTCAVPQTLAPAGQPGDSYSCSITVDVPGNAGDVIHNVATASGLDDDGNPVSASDFADVTIDDVPSAIQMIKTATPDHVDEPGGSVTYDFAVNNLSAVDSVTIEILNDTIYGDLTAVPGSTCMVPQTLAPAGQPGDSYSCSITVDISGNAGDVIHNVAIALGLDDDGNPVSDDDDADVTIDDVPSDIEVIKTATPDHVDEPGDDVTFSFTVNNLSTVDAVTLDSLTDTIYGDLNGQGNCAVPQTIPAGGSYSCSITVYVSGEAGDVHTNVVTASGTDDDGNPVSDADDATVTVDDVPSDIEVIKTATPGYVAEPGDDVTFSFTVNNLSTVDTVTLDSLTDTVFGDLNGQGDCAVPQTIPAGGSYSCSITVYVSGEAEDVHTNVVTASGTDDDGNPVSDADDATVFIEGPTAITLASFTAEPGVGSVVLAWETGTEIDNAGFNLYRASAPGGPYVKVNGALIAAQGDPVAGGSYSFLDEDLAPGTYYYKLEDVDLNGTTTRHGPVSATVSPGLRRPAYRPTLPEF